MATHRWKDLKHKIDAKRQEALRSEADAEMLEMELRALREMVGLTQDEVARRLNVSQGQVSETERRQDRKLSTLHKYVEALGGELEIVARFGDRSIRLHAV